MPLIVTAAPQGLPVTSGGALLVRAFGAVLQVPTYPAQRGAPPAVPLLRALTFGSDASPMYCHAKMPMPSLDVLTSFARALSQASNYITCHSVAQLGVTLARLDVDWLAVNLAPCLHVLFAPLEKCRYSSAVCLRGLCSPHVFHDAYPSVAGRPAPTPRAFRASQRNRAYKDSSWRPRWAKPLHRCANPRCGGPSAGNRRYTQETCHLS